MNNQSPVIYGDGKQSRDFTYVDNVVEANLIAALVESQPGIAMNCACNEQIILNDVVRYINEILNKNIQPVYENARPGEIKHSYAEISLIRKNLKFNPSVKFKEGLIKTINTYN